MYKNSLMVYHGSQRIQKYLNEDFFLEKTLKMISASKSTGLFKSLEKSLKFTVGLNSVNGDLNQS